MRPLRYLRPHTLEDVLVVLAEHGRSARVLAGGTDLLVRLRLGHIQPEVVVDVKHARGWRADIVQTGDCIRIGAGAVMTDLLADSRIRSHFPALIEAARVVGSVQIRNRATLAGNICNASPAADTAPALLVYGASANLLAMGGRRQVPLTQFFTGPGTTVLGTGEVVESLDLPLPAAGTGAAFGRLTRRYGVDLAIVNLCCLVTRSGHTRFAFGAVGPRPFLVEERTGTLAAERSKPADRDAILAGLLAHAMPIADVRAERDYRAAMLDVVSRRALHTAMVRAR